MFSEMVEHSSLARNSLLQFTTAKSSEISEFQVLGGLRKCDFNVLNADMDKIEYKNRPETRRLSHSTTRDYTRRK